MICLSLFSFVLRLVIVVDVSLSLHERIPNMSPHHLVCLFVFCRSMNNQMIDGKNPRLQLKNHSRKKTKYYSDELLPSNSSTEIDQKMLSCHSCRTAFVSVHNPSLTKDGYSCENCRMKNQIEEKIVLPFSFNPKKNLQLNGFRKNSIKFPTSRNEHLEWIVR